ncbi:hypothetical protein OKA05_28100 [Luteolibacter arcticus]|uniref:Uncharacterized protein n=1 Tax=Luteolibacter arcticus TaxID=1581411 RepID=A0ABT3GSF1_9BACT|nr:hypothetical protein [Luteolibacter arcticus]MCW1926446.1 hypothetical protein [Luteolibacter arcticus]
MHSSLSSPNLERQGLSRMPSRVMLKDDFCQPVPDNFAPLSLLQMPAPVADIDDAAILDSLDDLPPRPRSRANIRSRRSTPPFVPFQPETFLNAKDPWAVHSLKDLIGFFLPEISVSIALMSVCGLMAGKLLARWANGIQPLWVLGLYLAVLFLHLGSLYLGGKGGSSSHLKTSLRTLVLGLFLLLLPHSVAFLFLSANG